MKTNRGIENDDTCLLLVLNKTFTRKKLAQLRNISITTLSKRLLTAEMFVLRDIVKDKFKENPDKLLIQFLEERK